MADIDLGGSDGEEELLEDRGGQRETHTTGDTKYCRTGKEVCWPRPGLKRKSQGRGFHAWEARVEREVVRMFLAERTSQQRWCRHGRESARFAAAEGDIGQAGLGSRRAAPPLSLLLLLPAVVERGRLECSWWYSTVSVSTRRAGRLGTRGPWKYRRSSDDHDLERV